MSDERPSAGYYRQVAAELERLADESQAPDIRRELRELAERFRRMAERRERSR
ncbi:MAG TPA: hypothetical protein VG651_24760 [Stellaceae bacterium]|nr:hypothetical protein [Stellaceae bacterium]